MLPPPQLQTLLHHVSTPFWVDIQCAATQRQDTAHPPSLVERGVLLGRKGNGSGKMQELKLIQGPDMPYVCKTDPPPAFLNTHLGLWRCPSCTPLCEVQVLKDGAQEVVGDLIVVGDDPHREATHPQLQRNTRQAHDSRESQSRSSAIKRSAIAHATHGACPGGWVGERGRFVLPGQRPETPLGVQGGGEE